MVARDHTAVCARSGWADQGYRTMMVSRVDTPLTFAAGDASTEYTAYV